MIRLNFVFVIFVFSGNLFKCEDTSDFEQIESRELLSSSTLDIVNFAPFRKVTEQCLQKCPDQNRSLSDHLELSHRKDCLLADNASTNIATCLCSIGCQLWQSALSSSCHSVCNRTDTDILEPKELYCVMGCNDALSRYLKWLKAEIGNPPAPALVADTLTATALSLEWEIPKRLAENTKGLLKPPTNYLVQYKFEEIPDDWKFCTDHVVVDSTTIHVENLQPYTKYRFRIALPLSTKQDEFLFSDQSIIINTLAQGRPQEPANVRAIAVDHTRISVSWTPGAFPNGPILSYKLQIKDSAPVGYSAIKDVPASDESNFYIFEKLTPSHNYTVSVTTRNAEGEGPATSTSVMMPPERQSKDDVEEQPRLILGTEHTILSQGYDLLSEKPNTFYYSENRIIATAIHIKKKIIFVTEESGYVFKAPLYVEGKKLIVISPDVSVNVTPKLLSVDWLNDNLYVLGEVQHANTKVWQISRCDLEGQKSTIAIAGLTHEPKHIEVDPYNGYLFWVIPGNTSESGLYRLDLAEISNGVRHEDKPLHMLQGERLGAFTIEHVRFRLLVPKEDDNTVISVNLDGRNEEDIRKNTPSPMFTSVESIVLANGLFYWTNGCVFIAEDYHKLQNIYYHNAYPDLSNGTIISVHVDLPSSQPTPIPVNPPVQVQALFGPKRAKISWEPPHLLGNQGKGAWKKWNYTIDIFDEKNRSWTSYKDIQGTTFVIDSLKSNSHYVVRAAANTSAGQGPWSKEFRAKTLRNNQRRLLVWSSNEGLMQSDVVGEHVTTIIKRLDLDDCKISDIAWYQSLLYIVCNSTLMIFNRNSSTLTKVGELDSIESIAVDWIGNRLYWSNPIQQSITRADLNGEQQEPLPILQIAKEIKIDSLGGYMYYSTGHAIEGCRLNGKNRTTFYRSQLYSGMQVIGLTLDFDSRQLFWIVRSYRDSTLYTAAMLDDNAIENVTVTETLLTDKNLTGPLVYFSDRLLWITDDNALTISNKTGQNLATIRNNKLNGVQSVTVIEPIRQQSTTEYTVIPNAVLTSSIAAHGAWNMFNITWDPVRNVNYGKVFYEIRISIPGHAEQLKEVDETFFEYTSDTLEPYTQMDITIRALTYWGFSASSRTSIYSPEAAPSAPTEPRVFVSHLTSPLKRRPNIKAIFRWKPPSKPNGPILGYKVLCLWEEDRMGNHTERETKNLEITLTNLIVDTKYSFRVVAYTSVGPGEISETVVINTRNESPLPQVISATNEGLLLVDLDLQSSALLTHLESPVASLTYLQLMDKIFWFDENNELFSYNTTKVKLLSVTSRVLALAIDWVEFVLYWSQVETNGSAIYSLNLHRFEQEKSPPEKLIYRNANITELKVSPMDRIVFWNEVNGDRSIISYYKVDRQTVETFNVFEHPCHNKTAKLRLVTLDVSNGTPSILMGADAGNALYAVSILSKVCHQFDFHFKSSMISLSKDFDKFYWFDSGVIYCKNFISRRIARYEMTNVQHLVAFHQQDYPRIDCLVPTQREPPSQQVKEAFKETTSLTVQLPQPHLNAGCNMSAVGTKYKILYKEYSPGDQLTCELDNCTVLYSFDATTKIDNLSPFTEYLFQVGVNNFYGEKIGIHTHLGPPKILQTAPGAPSQPRNLTAEAISPTEAVIRWIPPKELNSNAVWFEVHWQTENTVDKLKNKQQLVVQGFDASDPRRNQEMTKHLNRLHPNHTYSVWVRAYSSNHTFSETHIVNILTFPEPEDIHLLEITPYSLDIAWIPPEHVSRYLIKYKSSSVQNKLWIPVFDSAELESPIFTLKNMTVSYLSPKIQYQFVMFLYFEKRSEPYIWPHDKPFTYETLGDRPSTPGRPKVKHLDGEAYQVYWDSSTENGASIDMYVLEGLQRRREVTVTEGPEGKEKDKVIEDKENNDWAMYYNGTDAYWITSNVKNIHLYGFKVRAHNSYGWSNYSLESDPVSDIVEAGLSSTILYTSVMGLIFILAIIVISTIIVCVYRWKLPKKQSFKDAGRVPGVELSNLRELPCRSNFITASNSLYNGGPLTDIEIAALPQIKKEQITMTKFLGSGAFGEVYEGILRAAAEKDQRVAIKTLGKSATEQEKMEFLKEAQLMSNFKHEHILKLIGVCFDFDTLYIIMELMQGGDLLSYLRQNRPDLGQPSSLKLIDIISMCVDVAAGCRYLEEMHFVHRDLAARNCLVSSLVHSERVVKIGDFGLARDIYKNDYYRKEGEGLLPVRWMSPESLVYGVFTSQSDIWAFGVLCWEIMTLGQQPYPARNNIEVLNYVREGGRLTRPRDCPEELHQLMLKCWSYNPEGRPTFRYCLEVLKNLKDKTSPDIQLTAQVPTKILQGSVFNKSYIIQDINHNNNNFNHFHDETFMFGHSSRSNERFPTPDTSTTAVSQVPALSVMAGSAVVTIPKYIQVVYDENDAVPQQSSSATDSQHVSSDPRQPYEIPIVLATNYSPNSSSSVVINNNKENMLNTNSSVEMQNEISIPISIGAGMSSNCSSLSSPIGDESMQALLPQQAKK